LFYLLIDNSNIDKEELSVSVMCSLQAYTSCSRQSTSVCSRKAKNKTFAQYSNV